MERTTGAACTSPPAACVRALQAGPELRALETDMLMCRAVLCSDRGEITVRLRRAIAACAVGVPRCSGHHAAQACAALTSTSAPVTKSARHVVPNRPTCDARALAQDCFTGRSAVDWLIDQGHTMSRSQVRDRRDCWSPRRDLSAATREKVGLRGF